MATRRDSREWAVQLLFQQDFNRMEIEKAFTAFWKEKEADARSRKHTEALVRGVCEHAGEIDELISRHAKNWKISRMNAIDRNVLRLGVYEMLHCHDIPPVVSINEAVDLSKYFGSSDSGRFVNGIMDGISRELNRPARTASPDAVDNDQAAE